MDRVLGRIFIPPVLLGQIKTKGQMSNLVEKVHKISALIAWLYGRGIHKGNRNLKDEVFKELLEGSPIDS